VFSFTDLVGDGILDFGQALSDLGAQGAGAVAVIPADLLAHQCTEVCHTDGCSLALAALGPRVHLQHSNDEGAQAKESKNAHQINHIIEQIRHVVVVKLVE
jgi:hypothetical protein